MPSSRDQAVKKPDEDICFPTGKAVQAATLPAKITVLTELVDRGDGHFLRRTYQRRIHPRLALINGLYIASTAISVTLMIFFDLRIGLAILGASVGTFSLLRSRVYPRFIRGPLLREENVSYPTTYRQLPTARLMDEWAAYHRGPRAE